MEEVKTLVLIDGHALAFRQYYALERTNMQTKDGTPTWAVYGFFKAIFDLLKNKNISPNAIGVAFDVSHHTFRTEKYEEYKANREAMPDPMRIQMSLIYEGLKAFNIPIYTKEGFEADDVIGTISKKACELGHKVYILTGDQDSFQLIRKDGCVKVIIPSKGELIEYDWAKVFEKLGVYPNQVIDYKALRGDTSDNIPGVKGIGEKTAAKLLAEFGTVDNVLENVEQISGNSVREKIKNGIEIAKLSKFLATIVQDVDIDFNFENTKIDLPDIAQVTEFLRSMQFYSFLKNIEFILKLFNKETEIQNNEIKQSDNILSVNTDNGQLGLFAQSVQENVNEAEFPFDTNIITTDTELNGLVEKLKNNNLISINMLYKFENSVNFDLYGLIIGLNNNLSIVDEKIAVHSKSDNLTSAYFIPFKNTGFSKLLEPRFVFESLKSILEDNKIKKIVHDLKTKDSIFRCFGIDIQGIIFDTMLACYIKDSNINSTFDIQCMEQINHILPSMVSNEQDLRILNNSQESIKNYIGDITASLFFLTKYWVEVLSEKEYKILQEIEIPLSKVLADIEITGVSIDEDYLAILTADFDLKLGTLEKKIYSLAGMEFNIKSPKQVATVLFDKMELTSGKKRGKTKKSTSAEVLNQLAEDYEIARLILDYRKYAKLKSTYTEVLPTLVDKKDNRIHTSFNQTATTTGRLSSSNPNLQNIPIRTEEGNKIRRAFVPCDTENYMIMSADYSQIELRLLAHVSNDEHLINAFNSGVDVHTLTASKVFDIPIEDVTKDMRYKAKAVNFGIIYGQTKYGLAKALKISPNEAGIFIDKYFETYPNIKTYMDSMIELVEKQGYVETILGRKRYLNNEIESPNAMIREFAKRAAINHPMQGSASDLIKLAMIDFENKLKENNCKSRLILQVHDELVIELAKNELDLVKKLVLEAMELNQPLRVPLLVDVNVGVSWKES